jgi:hypothetical protein
MKIVSEQLWALMKVQQRMRKVRQTNGLKEFLPDEYRSAFGDRNTDSGSWRYLNLPPLWNDLNPQGGLTEWGKECGIAGGMTTCQSKNIWSRFGECAIPAHHMDNHNLKNGRNNYCGWSCGCPCWYSEHQP